MRSKEGGWTLPRETRGNGRNVSHLIFMCFSSSSATYFSQQIEHDLPWIIGVSRPMHYWISRYTGQICIVTSTNARWTLPKMRSGRVPLMKRPADRQQTIRAISRVSCRYTRKLLTPPLVTFGGSLHACSEMTNFLVADNIKHLQS